MIPLVRKNSVDIDNDYFPNSSSSTEDIEQSLSQVETLVTKSADISNVMEQYRKSTLQDLQEKKGSQKVGGQIGDVHSTKKVLTLRDHTGFSPSESHQNT
ncbi:11597_t:CDS:2 [Funneliformis geosporum]|nr:11597_t:CDS:2 [Funneliformis geosporum]